MLKLGCFSDAKSVINRARPEKARLKYDSSFIIIQVKKQHARHFVEISRKEL